MMIYVFTLIYILLAIIIGLAIITDFIKLSFENYISLFTLLGAWIGGIFTFKQWKETNKIKKAEYINMLTEKIRTDKDIKNTIYLFDYGKKIKIFDDDFFNLYSEKYENFLNIR